jgi:uncharacterized membrane protein
MAGQTPNHCRSDHCFNIIESAAHLAPFAGVLTALTFSAIIYLVGHTRREEIEDVLIVFCAGFVALVFATYLLSEGAAEELADSRAAFSIFCASIVLATAILYLFLGLGRLTHDHELYRAGRFASRVASWLLGPAAFAFVLATAVGSWGLHKTESRAWDSPLGWSGLAMLAILGMISAGLLKGLPKTISAVRWAELSLVIIAIPTGLYLWWGERGRTATMPGGVYIGFMALLLVAMSGYSVVLNQMRGEMHDSGQNESAVQTSN